MKFKNLCQTRDAKRKRARVTASQIDVAIQHLNFAKKYLLEGYDPNQHYLDPVGIHLDCAGFGLEKIDRRLRAEEECSVVNQEKEIA